MSGRVKKEVEETDFIKPLLFNKEQLKSVKDVPLPLPLPLSLAAYLNLLGFLRDFQKLAPPDTSDLAFFSTCFFFIAAVINVFRFFF
jgi:hypothetical protein